jgi:3-deoxy-7-phosphoheptulonate synthase
MPRELKAQFPPTPNATDTVVRGRQAISAILKQADRRLLVVVGPCSIHDPAAALEYATKLNTLRQEVEDQFC